MGTLLIVASLHKRDRYFFTNHTGIIYEFISTLKTWDSALEYCRKQHTDLAMIENSAKNTQVSSVIPAYTQAWIGLYRVPWTWSDMSQSTFRNWQRSSPNNYGGNQFCMAESSQHYWDDDTCNVEFPFILSCVCNYT
uniref:C-type lectin domain-containing protein n=1 Tax=Lates calcarifer TaxID=8187 RepID=A0A4W6DVX8_LATCA